MLINFLKNVPKDINAIGMPLKDWRESLNKYTAEFDAVKIFRRNKVKWRRKVHNEAIYEGEAAYYPFSFIKHYGYDLNIETSAYDNIRAGVHYLRILLDLTGDMDQAMAAYYQGYASLSLGVLYEDTIRYVADIKAIRDSLWP